MRRRLTPYYKLTARNKSAQVLHLDYRYMHLLTTLQFLQTEFQLPAQDLECRERKVWSTQLAPRIQPCQSYQPYRLNDAARPLDRGKFSAV